MTDGEQATSCHLAGQQRYRESCTEDQKEREEELLQRAKSSHSVIRHQRWDDVRQAISEGYQGCYRLNYVIPS